jgi:asparagine synthase (glutamine-hydrolysing)
MCGIAGILRFDQTPVTAADVTPILNNIAHRGRDHSAIKLNNEISRSAAIGLAHRRLSIIDLQPAGAQPMFYADQQLCITYNGEIYNYLALRKLLEQKFYTFKTNTDTEVLLAAYHFWGKDCVNHFDGMFAFAIWDEKNQYLFCARDPVGIKPFYYLKTNNYIALASEALALAHLSPSGLNEASVSSYFLSMYVATNESIFAGIKKLAAGSTMVVRADGQMLIERYWSVNQFEETTVNATTQAELSEALRAAVKRQVQSDVPVGGFLSGGVDSGLITALAAPLLNTYHTYSVGYEGMQSNELDAAQELAQRFATRHTAVTLRAADAMGILDNALHHLSEPIADPAIVATYHLAELAAGDGVKVLLNGTGGDEIFGGYTRYSGQLSLKRKLMTSLPPFLKKLMTLLPINHKLKRRLQLPAFDMMFSTGGSYDLAESVTPARFFVSLFTQLGAEFSAQAKPNVPLLYQQMLFDMQVYLPDQLLFLLDQMTMAHTLEGRVPLLDTEVIKLAFKFSAKEHLEGGQTKAILKKIAEPLLGAAHVNRKKQGFAGSPAWWVQHNFGRFMEVIAELKHVPYFEKFNIDVFLNQARPLAQQSNDIFILYCFSQWYSRMKTCVGVVYNGK